MAQYTKYITKQGDRWDTIAYKAYGIATKIKPIMDANKTVSRRPVLDAGIELLIPIIDEAVIKGNNDVPPWKESDVIDNGFQEDQNSEVIEESRINESANPARYRLINSNGRQLTEGVITAGTIGEIKSPDAYISFNGGEPVPVATGETHDITAPPAYVILKDTSGEVLDERDVASGAEGELTAPDAMIEIYDQDDNLIDSGSAKSGSVTPFTVNVPEPEHTAQLLKTMQPTSFEAGDDGDTQRGQHFFKMPQNNIFGHEWRLTGVTGGYYDADTLQYKNVDGSVIGTDPASRLLAFPDGIMLDHGTTQNGERLGYDLNALRFYGYQNMTWSDAVDFATTLTTGGYSDWTIMNKNEMMRLDWSENGAFAPMGLWNNLSIGTQLLICGTTTKDMLTGFYMSYNIQYGTVEYVNKTTAAASNRLAIYVRYFTDAELS